MEDAQIVDLYWQRSDSAIEHTAARYGGYLRTVARSILQDERDAEECVNDTYLAAWNSMPDNRPAALAPYLGRIDRNFALTRLEARGALKRGGGTAAASLDELAEVVAGSEDPQRTVEARELSAYISAFLRALPKEEREVFTARYWYMLPVNEIAGRFGYTRARTAGMLHRTRGKLRAALKKEGLL
ncbi:MAG: sigma-70 family RNA polymerase sigma factor [Oscillospiraceae bacterium]|nr:sigma-70 family RNA polymerase sigma factor [Oscillospiraceae bacterium]